MIEDRPVRMNEERAKEGHWLLEGAKGILEFSVHRYDDPSQAWPGDFYVHCRRRQDPVQTEYPDCSKLNGKCFYKITPDKRDEAFQIWKRRSYEGVWRYMERVYDELI